jgi:hypothetical protein
MVACTAKTAPFAGGAARTYPAGMRASVAGFEHRMRQRADFRRSAICGGAAVRRVAGDTMKRATRHGQNRAEC